MGLTCLNWDVGGIILIFGIFLLQISRHLSHRHSLLFLIAEQSHVGNHKNHTILTTSDEVAPIKNWDLKPEIWDLVNICLLSSPRGGDMFFLFYKFGIYYHINFFDIIKQTTICSVILFNQLENVQKTVNQIKTDIKIGCKEDLIILILIYTNFRQIF